ncbi:hypothetical protein G9A89_017545 [Geosiphon pyriformis]|nr:hypothetical protein G9A89_017545 [Geosiphon pyriformis]
MFSIFRLLLPPQLSIKQGFTSFRFPLRQYSTNSTFNRPGPVPLGNPEEQKEFEDLVRKKQGSLFSNFEAAVEAEEETMHPDVRRKPPPQFEGYKNPETGELNGPKENPLKHGDWSYGARVTDF